MSTASGVYLPAWPKLNLCAPKPLPFPSAHIAVYVYCQEPPAGSRRDACAPEALWHASRVEGTLQLIADVGHLGQGAGDGAAQPHDVAVGTGQLLQVGSVGVQHDVRNISNWHRVQ